MIIDDKHRSAFIHIPKCGGTSISMQLRGVDSYGGAFTRRAEHPDLGHLDYTHIPMKYLEAYFPNEFAKIADYRSFALTRAPHVRFASAIFHRIQEFKGMSKLSITSRIALREAKHVISWLGNKRDFYDPEYIHFTRQVDYVALAGQMIVRNVFAIENIADLAAAIESAIGVPLDPGRRENANYASTGRFLAVLHKAKPLYSRLSTWAFREKLLSALRRWKIQNPAPLYEDLHNDPDIRGFVTDYYSDDFILHEAAAARRVLAASAGDAAFAADRPVADRASVR